MQPYNITQAIGLAKLVEAKLKDSKPKFYKNSYNPTPNQTNQFRFPATPPPNPPSLPIKRLTQAQMQERRAQGLCYNCDEKFVPGHKCSTSRFLLLMVDDESPGEEAPKRRHKFPIITTSPNRTALPTNTQIPRYHSMITSESAY
jgi:hypothetical protein